MDALPRIHVKSHRQAMDWSLVLASQGIETWIQDDPDLGLGLLVEPANFHRAQAALRAYQVENRRFKLRRPVFGSEVIFDWASLGWVFLIVFFFLLDSERHFREAGIMSSSAVQSGEWWRLFTSIWLHADSGHLAANASVGVLLLGLVMGVYGPGVGLFLTCLSGVLGNVGVLLLGGTPHQSLGASGAVMGAVGLLAATPALGEARWFQKPKFLVSGLLAGILLFVLLGSSENSDVLAHATGFISGVPLGLLAALQRNRLNQRLIQTAAGVLTSLLIIVPWAVALQVFPLAKG